MRPITVRQSALGYTAWIQMNRLQKVTNAGLAVVPSSGASLTYRVEHTLDNIHEIYTEFALTRSGTVATVTQVGHGLSVGDWVQVLNGGDPFDGVYTVTTVSSVDVFTVTVAGSGLTTANNGKTLQKARVFPHLILVDLAVRAVSNYAFPCYACRLNNTVWASGSADLTILQGN